MQSFLFVEYQFDIKAIIKMHLTRLLALVIGVLFIFGVGTASGAWLAARHYRPLVDDAVGKVVNCVAARNKLEGLAMEQGLKLGDLVLAGNERQTRAEQAVKDAQVSAQADYAAANRLQQKRTGGDQCAASAAIIDKELGL